MHRDGWRLSDVWQMTRPHDMTRDHALLLMGEDTLRRQEAMAAEAWCEAVERGEAA